MKLEITKERVLEAASKCSTAKETLKTLFPDVFETSDDEIVASIGDKFIIEGEKYILCKAIHGHVIFTCLSDGGRWDEEIQVGNLNRITFAEFSKLVNRDIDYTKKVLKTKHK